MKRMRAAEFKAKCLKVMDDVAATGQTVVVTKRGKPVARVAPPAHAAERFVGRLRGSVTVHGDLVAPLGVAWEANAH